MLKLPTCFKNPLTKLRLIKENCQNDSRKYDERQARERYSNVGLKVKGRKVDLRKRLLDHVKKNAHQQDNTEVNKLL